MDFIKNLYKNEPAICNAVIGLIAVLIQHFTLNYSTDIKVAVDALVAALVALATRAAVVPAPKLQQAGLPTVLPKVTSKANG